MKNEELMLELLRSLKAISEGQTKILEELKDMKSQPSEELVPMQMPDGSVRLVSKSALSATTDPKVPSRIRVVESPAMTREPWPDPNIPKPPIQR